MNNEIIQDQFDPSPYVCKERTETFVREVKKSFELFDSQHKGWIVAKQLKDALSDSSYFAKNEPIYQVVADFAAEGNGKINFEQFLHLLTSRLIHQDKEENWKLIFKLFDEQKIGYITSANLRKIALEMKLPMEEDEIEAMVRKADPDRDGFVMEKDFVDMMSQIV